MAVFAKFDGIDGESMKQGYEQYIEVESTNFGIHAPMQMVEGTGHSGGSPQVSDITFQLTGGKHSHIFENHILRGQPFAEVIIEYTKATGEDTQETYFKMTLKSAFISSYSTDKASDGAAYENVALSAEEITREYKAQDDKGKLTTVGENTWNVKTATAS